MTVTVADIEFPEPETFSRAGRLRCLDCAGGSAHEVKMCSVESCPMWRFRFGILPETAEKRGYNVKKHIDLEKEERLRETRRRGTREERAAAGEIMRAAKAHRNARKFIP